MRPIKLTILALLPVCSSALQAQTVLADEQTWNESHINAVSNIQYGSSNPVSIAHNEVKKYGVARVNYNFQNGDFRSPDTPAKDGHLGVYIGGLQSVKKFDLSGSFSYDNAQRRNMRWNSTLGLNEYNPFILVDSVKADRTVESFDLRASGVYNINDRWKAGLQIAYTTARLSDQTDPRPETSLSNFPITLGGEYKVSDRIQLGLSFTTCLYRSDIDYTIINPLDYYQYFLLKGNGDFYRRSSADVSGYEREYTGTSNEAAIQMTYRLSDQASNYLQAGFRRGSEDATDEGNTPFKGGDYSYGRMTLSDRFMWRNDRYAHNVIFSAQYAYGNGDWHEQKKKVDTEHGNRIYYDVLSTYKVYSNSNLQASLGYSFIKFNAQGQRDFMVDATVGMRNDKGTHYDEEVQSQKATMCDAKVSVGKLIPLGRVSLDAILRGGYQMPLSTTYVDASTMLNESIAGSYTAPMFQYKYAQAMNVGLQLDAHMPVVKTITCGVTLTANYQRCLDKCEWAEALDSSHRTYLEAGVYMKF